MKVLLACLLGLSAVNAQDYASCEEIQNGASPIADCPVYFAGTSTADFCCMFAEGGDMECVTADCDEPTTPTPVEDPVETPSPVEICYCETSMPTMATTPSPTTKSAGKKTKGSSSGSGYGDCDCDKDYGVVELRFIYQGSAEPVTMNFQNKDRSFTYCTFTGVMSMEEVTCKIEGSGYSGEDFETETFFDITADSGTVVCAVGAESYHTSCSSDIVGVSMCNGNIICSGWKDGNPNDNNDCDDGQEECECDTDTDATPTPTTPTPTPNGDEPCYCEVENCTAAPTTSTSASSKGGKKGKSKSKSKSKSSDSGAGCGDCDCDKDYGMVELRVGYTGTEEVTIEWYDKGGDDKICLDSENVSYGTEATCNVNDYTDANGDPVYEKLETNTFAKLVDSNGDEVCTTEIHTSCSRDIVGTEGEGDCAAGLIVVTGWKDGNPNDDNNCDDGWELCDCDDEGVEPVNIEDVIDDMENNGGYSAYVVANANENGELSDDSNQIRLTLSAFICALAVIKALF